MPPVDLHPLAGVLLGRTVPLDHVRALVAAGRLPAFADDFVPAGYLDELDPDPVPELPEGEWRDHLERETERYREGRRRLIQATESDRARAREQQLMRIASAAWGAGLALLMAGRRPNADAWLDRAGTLYRRSLADAEPGSWGRSVACLKCRLLAGDRSSAVREARWTMELGASEGASATARYAASLALLVLGRDREASELAGGLLSDDGFPPATARALVALADHDGHVYADSVADVLRTFELRERFLEDIPVADTVLTLQALAQGRLEAPSLVSARLPGRS